MSRNRTQPEIVICRHAVTGTVAHGGDALAHRLLERAGFQWEPYFHTFYYRLNYDYSHATQQRMATDAARMLRACHYQVHLAPDLNEDLTPEQRVTGSACPAHPDLRPDS